MENKISSAISWRRCCLRRRLHEHLYEVFFGPPLRVGDGSSMLPGGLLLPGQGLCRRLWIRSSSSPVGMLTDGLSVLRLFHDAEAAGGGFGSAGFDLGFGSGRSRPRRSNGMTELGKMNRSSLDSFVIFLFFRILFVKLGLYCSSV